MAKTTMARRRATIALADEADDPNFLFTRLDFQVVLGVRSGSPALLCSRILPCYGVCQQGSHLFCLGLRRGFACLLADVLQDESRCALRVLLSEARRIDTA